MQNLRGITSIILFLGWLAFCVCIGAAAGVMAGTTAGFLALLLSLFFTGAGWFLVNHGLNETVGCLSLVGALIWLCFSILALASLLTVSMAAAWANTFAVLIVAAWLVVAYINSIASK